MHMAQFLSSLPSSFDSVKSQILVSRDLSSLSEVFSRLRQVSLSGLNISQGVNGIEKSTLVTTTGDVGNFRGSRSSRGYGGRGRGRSRGLRKCTQCGGDNHTVDFCYKLHGRPSANQVMFHNDIDVQGNTITTPIAPSV